MPLDRVAVADKPARPPLPGEEGIPRESARPVEPGPVSVALGSAFTGRIAYDLADGEPSASFLSDPANYDLGGYTGPFLAVEDGKVVPDRDAIRAARRKPMEWDRQAVRKARAGLRKAKVRLLVGKARRRVLPSTLRQVARPRASRRSRVLRVRARGSSSASRDGPGEPDPPLARPGPDGLADVVAA